MPSWRDRPGYSKNDLFEDMGNRPFTLEEFIARGWENYELKEVTCKQKLRRGLNQGLVKRLGGNFFRSKLIQK